MQGVSPTWGGGGGGHSHPIPALGGFGGHKPPLGEDHNFALPETGDPCGVGFGLRWVTTTPSPPARRSPWERCKALAYGQPRVEMHAPHAGAASKPPISEERPVEQARVGWRAPGRVHGMASMEET